MMRTACLVCFISFVNGHSKKKPWKVGASSLHTTNLKQSIFAFRYLWCWATVVLVPFAPFVASAAVAALAAVAAVAAIPVVAVVVAVAMVATVAALAAVATVAAMAAVASVASMAAVTSTYLSTTVNYARKI